MIRSIFRCPKCGGTDVAARAWVNPNLLPGRTIDVDWIDEPDVFCNDCCATYSSWEVQAVDLVRGKGGDMVRMDDGKLVPLEKWLGDNPVPGNWTVVYSEYGEGDDDGGEGE